MTANVWEPLPREPRDEPQGIITSADRLTVLFHNDDFVSMLNDQLITKLVIVLAKNYAVWSPNVTASIIRQTPYSKLWTQSFVEHIESLVWIASGIDRER